MRACSRCGASRPFWDFYRTATEGRRRAACIACERATRRARYAADPEPTRARMREYRGRHEQPWAREG
jgi:hypothetical protein